MCAECDHSLLPPCTCHLPPDYCNHLLNVFLMSTPLQCILNRVARQRNPLKNIQSWFNCALTSNGLPSYSKEKAKCLEWPTDTVHPGPYSPALFHSNPSCSTAATVESPRFFNTPGMSPPSRLILLPTLHFFPWSALQGSHPLHSFHILCMYLVSPYSVLHNALEPWNTVVN